MKNSKQTQKKEIIRSTPIRASVYPRVKSGATCAVKCAAVLAAAMVIGGCGQHDVSHPNDTISHIESTGSQPMVLNNMSPADQAAFDTSERTLTASEWQKLETIGPRPMWDRLRE